MKAITCNTYGSPDVLKLEDIPTPSPGVGQVLVRVRAASVNAGDWHILRADPFVVRLEFGMLRPKFPVLGMDVAGVVEAVGEGASAFKPGDEVFGDLAECGCGAFAEFALAAEDALVLKPATLGFEQAAAVPTAAVTALQGLRNAGVVAPGARVLIHGASGGVGTFAVQIAKALGAEVTAVCSTSKVEMVRELGADHVIDYTQEDFAAGGARFDKIFVAYGERGIFEYARALLPGGTCVVSGGSFSQFLRSLVLGPLVSLTKKKRIVSLLQRPSVEDLAFIKDLIESGKVTPVIDRSYPLAEVPEAIRYVEQGHARGKVVIVV